jgi:hypothetical protein
LFTKSWSSEQKQTEQNGFLSIEPAIIQGLLELKLHARWFSVKKFHQITLNRIKQVTIALYLLPQIQKDA